MGPAIIPEILPTERSGGARAKEPLLLAGSQGLEPGTVLWGWNTWLGLDQGALALRSRPPGPKKKSINSPAFSHIPLFMQRLQTGNIYYSTVIFCSRSRPDPGCGPAGHVLLLFPARGHPRGVRSRGRDIYYSNVISCSRSDPVGSVPGAEHLLPQCYFCLHSRLAPDQGDPGPGGWTSITPMVFLLMLAAGLIWNNLKTLDLFLMVVWNYM